MTDEKKQPRWSISELVAKDKRRHSLKQKANDLNTKVELLKDDIIAGLKEHGLKSAEASGWSITVTEAENMVVDHPGVIAALTPAQRRLCCEERLDLNALPSDVRKKIIETLGKAERKKITTLVLDENALSRAVQQGKIPPTLASKFTTFKKKAPYISFSGPKKSS